MEHIETLRFVNHVTVMICVPVTILLVCPNERYRVSGLSECPCSWEGTSSCDSGTGGCVCKAGYTGTRCEHLINPCGTSNPPCRQMEMYCSPGAGFYTCVCRDGYRLSDLDYCAPCPPFRHGDNCSSICDCVQQNTLYCDGGTCVCKPAYGGQRCEHSHNYCLGVTCPKGTTCVNKPHSHACLCAAGYRTIQGTCQEFNVTAVTLDSSPGVGELVDILILYKLPAPYSAQQVDLPDFEYTLVVEESRKQLCQFSYKDTYKYVNGREPFFSKLKTIDSRSYNFYSQILVSFSNPDYTVVHLVPKSDEYYELILEFDVRHKSQAEIDCLQDMSILGTASALSRAVQRKRQSYHSFEIKWNPSSDCTETPRVEWKYFTITREHVTNPQNCMNWKTVTELDIDDLTTAAGENAISDHKSLEDIIPKSTLPLGHILLCVTAYVENNQRSRASACGFIEVIPSFVLVGGIHPDTSFIYWGYRWGITLTANFVEPDAYSRLVYNWECIMLVGTTEPKNCSDFPFFENLDITQRVLNIPAGFLPHGNDIIFQVTAEIEKHRDVFASDSLRLLGDRSDNPYYPVTVECELNCGSIIGSGRDVILRAGFPHRLDFLINMLCYWGVIEGGRRMRAKETSEFIIPDYGYMYSYLTGLRSRINGALLKPGVNYTLSLACLVSTNEALGADLRRMKTYYSSATRYEFETESPPIGDGCTISPIQGEAAFSRFTVTCLDYIDPVARLPLIYKLHQLERLSESNTQVASGTIGNITLSTPGSSGKTSIHLMLDVVNVKGVKTRVPLSVQLITLDQAEALNKTKGNVQTYGGGQEDARAMKDISTIINSGETAAFEEKVAVRREVLRNVDNLDSKSKNNIEQVSYVLSVSVEKEDEIEPVGLEYGMSAANRLSKFLGKLSNEQSVVRTVAMVQINAVSKLLNIASSYGENISTSNETTMPEKENFTQQNIHQSALATESFVNIANALLNSITQVNAPIKVLTEFLDFVVALNNVSKDTKFAIDSDNVNFSLPTTHSGVLEAEIVESEFEVFKKNPYGWTVDRVHGHMPVVKVRLTRQKKKNTMVKAERKGPFRFSMPADVFIQFNATGEGNTYGLAIKVMKNESGGAFVRHSDCLFMTIKVSTTNATLLKITSPDDLKIMVKTKYTSDVTYFDKINDEDMLEMPLSVPNTFETPQGLLIRDSNLLIFPQLTKQQIKRNINYYRIKISIKLNQPVTTTFLKIIENVTIDDKEEPGNYYNVTIDVRPHAISCLHFDEAKQEYLSDECAISMFSDLRLLHCRCVVAAAFTGSVLVLPRLINPLDVFLFLKVFQNPLVVSMVIAIWLIFVALVVYGRKRDRDDETKIDVTVLDDNKESYTYVYMICVATGWSAASATSSNVFIYLKGSWKQTESHILQDPARRLFQSSAEDWFMLTTRADIGDLISVVVWTDFSGLAPSWFLSAVYVQNMQTQELWTCPFNSWIGIHQGVEQLEAEVPALKETEYATKWKLHIVNKGQNDIRNEHLWFGILAKTPYNRFTRVRRLSTGLSLLQTLMLLNLMFFDIRNKDDPGQFIEVLDQQIHVTSVIIGTQSAFIIFLLGIGIALMFNRVASPPKLIIKESEEKAESVENSLKRCFDMQRVQEIDSEVEMHEEDDDSKDTSSSDENSETLAVEGSTLINFDQNTNQNARKKASSVDPKIGLKRKMRPSRVSLGNSGK